MSDDDLTHVDERGRATMVDVSDKEVTRRQAVARGFVYMEAETLRRIRRGELEKGEVLQVARIAGVMAAKRTEELIPLCHGLALEDAQVEFAVLPAAGAIGVQATVTCHGKTGVEMEAIVAVSMAATTIYDMAKAIDRSMSIGDIHVFEKRGGRSGEFRNPDPPGPELAPETDWG